MGDEQELEALLTLCPESGSEIGEHLCSASCFFRVKDPSLGNGTVHSGQVFPPQLTLTRYLHSYVQVPMPQVIPGSVRLSIHSGHHSHLTSQWWFSLGD